MIKMKQTFCKHCCGIKKITIDGKVIPYKEWVKYGIAYDSGCVC